MQDTVIRVENLSKKYTIQHNAKRADTFRDALMTGVRSLGNRLRRPWQTNCSGTHEEFWALKDVNFEVKRGEVVGIIGRNGAGKSTLLKILSRITEPTTGRVTIDGRVASLLEVGTGFHPELTGRENIYLNGAILGMARAEITRKFHEIVAFAEVEKFLDTPVKHYSSGMYVRLAFAVAAHLQPEILIVDEVLAVGDVEFQKKCMGRMEHVANKGSTVILVSHNMGTVRSLCTDCLLLDDGHVKKKGVPEQIVLSYFGSAVADPVERAVNDEDYVHGGQKLRVDKIRLLEPAIDSFSVYWKQPIAVGLTLHALERLDNVSIGVGVKTMDGTWICCSHHAEYGSKSRLTLKLGKFGMKFTLENNLKPGMYKLVFGSFHHHYTNCLFHIEAVNLVVLDHSRDGLVPMVYTPGFVNGAAEWDGPLPV